MSIFVIKTNSRYQISYLVHIIASRVVYRRHVSPHAVEHLLLQYNFHEHVSCALDEWGTILATALLRIVCVIVTET